MDVELRHLRYFLAVAEELHFGRAAERLRIAQPSLSQQIRKLEQEIGTNLFERAHRRVELTAAGKALRAGAGRTLDDADAAIREAQQAARGIVGHLTVGFIESAAIRVVPEAVRAFSALRPQVGLTLRELATDTQIADIQEGRLDLGFVRDLPATAGLVGEVVLEEELLLAVPRDHPFAERRSLTSAEIGGEFLIAVERDILPGLYDETLNLIPGDPIESGIAQSATSVLAVLGLVAAGLGVAVLPGSVTDLPHSGAIFVEIQGSPRAAILAIRRSSGDSPLIDPFLDAVRTRVR